MNINKFIDERKLYKFDIDKIEEYNLPIQCFFGRLFLIKNNSIIECYNGVSTDNRHIEYSVIKYPELIEPYLKCIFTIYNIDKEDIKEFRNKSIFEKEEIVSYDDKKNIMFILNLLKVGFSIYLNY